MKQKLKCHVVVPSTKTFSHGYKFFVIVELRQKFEAYVSWKISFFPLFFRQVVG